MSNPQNNQPEGDHRSEKSESKAERVEKKAEHRERGEAVGELNDGKLNKHIKQENTQQKDERSKTLAEQIEKTGKAKIGPITQKHGQSIEITDGDKVLVKGRSKEEVAAARKQMEEASDKGMMLGSGGKFTDVQKSQEYGFGDDGRWHYQNPRLKPGQDIAGEIKEWLRNDAAKDIPNLPGAITSSVVNGAWALSEPLLKGINDWMQHKPDMTYMEYLTGIEKDRGRSPWKDVSFEGADKAYAAFPELAKRDIPKELISGIILNEVLHSGDPRDPIEDMTANLHGTVKDSHGKEEKYVSVGPAQMQIQNIRHLVENYPQLAQFKGDAVRAAINPENTPMFVAAYLTDKIHILDNFNKNHPEGQIPVNAATLAYMYNPDVDSKDGKYRRMDAADTLGAALHINTHEGWHLEPLAKHDEIIGQSKVIKDILSATRACKR
jgi:hypothetical protein